MAEHIPIQIQNPLLVRPPHLLPQPSLLSQPSQPRANPMSDRPDQSSNSTLLLPRPSQQPEANPLSDRPGQSSNSTLLLPRPSQQDANPMSDRPGESSNSTLLLPQPSQPGANPMSDRPGQSSNSKHFPPQPSQPGAMSDRPDQSSNTIHLVPQPSQPGTTSVSDCPDQSTNSVPERLMHKNRLQEYTQKSSLQLPVYQTINEGFQHAPKFRTTVLVNGTYYTSQETFPNRKAAEQDGARIALGNIQQKTKDDQCPIIQEDTTFCKSILNEYAVKMHLEKPSYHTIQPAGLIPFFVSSLVFDGVSYTGDKGKNKKEAEQMAARVIIQSILDSADSESATVMSGIIKSKYKLYAALNKISDGNSICSASIPVVNMPDLNVHLYKRKETEVTTSTVHLPITATHQSNLAAANIQEAHLPLHQSKNPRPETNTTIIAPPVVSTSPGLGRPPLSSSGKRNRRNKKKTKIGVQIGPQTAAAVGHFNQISPCSIAQ